MGTEYRWVIEYDARRWQRLPWWFPRNRQRYSTTLRGTCQFLIEAVHAKIGNDVQNVGVADREPLPLRGYATFVEYGTAVVRGRRFMLTPEEAVALSWQQDWMSFLERWGCSSS